MVSLTQILRGGNSSSHSGGVTITPATQGNGAFFSRNVAPTAPSSSAPIAARPTPAPTAVPVPLGTRVTPNTEARPLPNPTAVAVPLAPVKARFETMSEQESARVKQVVDNGIKAMESISEMEKCFLAIFQRPGAAKLDVSGTWENYILKNDITSGPSLDRTDLQNAYTIHSIKAVTDFLRDYPATDFCNFVHCVFDSYDSLSALKGTSVKVVAVSQNMKPEHLEICKRALSGSGIKIGIVPNRANAS